MEQREKKLRKVIVVLSVLLVLSLAALAGTLIYNRWIRDRVETVTVPDNFITSDAEDATVDENGQSQDDQKPGDSAKTVQDNRTAEKTENKTNALTAGNTQSSGNSTAASAGTSGTGTNGTNSSRQAVSISLYNKHAQDNTAFEADNMLPGDSMTRYFRIQVSHQNPVTVHYHADVQKGYEKLAEVLKLRIVLLSTDEVLYDGPIGEMPQSLDITLNARTKTTDEIYYEMTAYLDTSVGNDYQNLGLAADFRWWVDGNETGNLTRPPKTGDTFQLMLWLIVIVVSGTIIILWIINRRRRRDEI